MAKAIPGEAELHQTAPDLAPPKTGAFRLNFAPHLGFPTPATPLFAELVGSADPEAHIAFAALHGFRCIQDPFAAGRSIEEQVRIGRAAAAAGVGLGCFVFAPIARALQPAWAATVPAARAALDEDVEAAIAIGRRLGSRHIAVITGADASRPRGEQVAAVIANLARLAERVSEAGMVICLEAVNAHRLPGMLLNHLADAADIVCAVGHPAVRLIFDTGHVHAMDGDVLGNLDRTWDLIELIQLADHPDRVEPGAGELDFVSIIDEIERRGFAGPVELEHGWSGPGREKQEHYLKWLGQWSAAGGGILHGDLA